MGVELRVDRSEMADTAQPDQLAALLFSQIAGQLEQPLPLPIDEVAKACGIVEIRPLETDAFEGGLIQDEYKEHGFILVKAGVREDRRRFTIAHELGHFVNFRHTVPPGEEQLMCDKSHLRQGDSRLSGRFGMEAQANEFAAKLLMPESFLNSSSILRGSPEIGRLLKIQEICAVSKEAAARRYAELHGDDFAIVFSRDGKYLYSVRSGDFPWINIQKGQAIYHRALSSTYDGGIGEVSEQEESDGYWWLDDKEARRWELWEEVLVQKNGFRMTLILGEKTQSNDH